MDSKYNILFVEDDYIDRIAISRYIEREKPIFNFRIADSFQAAKGFLKAEPYDLIISDYQLGDGTAFDLIKLIDNIPIIFVTGLGDQEIAVKAMKAGAYDYVIKDDSGGHLYKIPFLIDSAMERKKAEIELHNYREHLEDLVKTRTKELEQEIEFRKNAENEVKQLNLKLEERVINRTFQLEKALHEVKYENEERKKVQSALRDSNEELRVLNEVMEEESRKLLLLNDKLARSEAKMKIANDAKDKFFSIIAHDLKNPMQALLFSTELLEKTFRKNDQKKIKNYIDRIKQTSLHLKDLLENLLTWSRSQRGGIEYSPSYIDLKFIFKEVIELLYDMTARKQIEIDLSISDETFVFSDPNLLGAIIRNLLSNSIKFTNIGGAVKCTAKIHDDFALVTVTDNGIGIREEDIEKLFRLDIHYTTSGTSDETGSGLGLILCKEFVEIQKGRIWVESVFGKGATFSFTIPLKT